MSEHMKKVEADQKWVV